jgi:hypothetical protein
MKVKYLREGVFKNPEQARAAREIANKEDNATSLAKLTTKLLEKPLSEILTKAIALDESTENWYEGTVLNSQVFDQLSLAFTFTEKTLNEKIIPTAEARIQDDGTIYIDFYFRINSEKIMNHFNSDAENITRALITWSPSYACNAFGPLSTMTPKLKKTLGLVGKLKNRVERMRWLNRDNNLKAAWQLFIHTPERKIKINKIHIFGDCVGDVYMSSYDDLHLVENSIPVMTEFFSFENKGEVYFVRRIFSWDHSYQGGGDEGREFKIYKLEGNTLKDYRIVGK